MNKRSILTLGALAAFGCGGGNVAVSLQPEGTGDVVATSGSQLNSSGGPAMRKLVVPITEISVHLAGKHADDQREEKKPEDADPEKAGWEVVLSEERKVDLLAIELGRDEVLGDVSLPEGKITQVRLKLARGEQVAEERIFADAVTEADGTTCDLRVPASAFDPGLKISGVFKEFDVAERDHHTVVVGFDIKDLTRGQSADRCMYRLKPVLKLHHVKND